MCIVWRIVWRTDVPAQMRTDNCHFYATDAAISKDVVIAGIFPEDTHPPIIYPIGLVKKNADSVKFYQFLQSQQAKTIFQKYGFSVLK